MSCVLVVDDDELNVIIFKRVLEKRGGFQVRHTEDVEEILKLCRDKVVDLVIMDISLDSSFYQGKYIDGIEITQLIKGDPKTKDIPVILATAHAMHGDEERFLAESGADGYIAKPVTDHAGFVQTIKTVLENKSTEE